MSAGGDAPASGGGGGRAAVIRRRSVSISGVAIAALVLTAFLLPVLAVTVVVDLVRAKPRLPLARVVLFGVCWAWMELAGVTAAGVLWLVGRRRDVAAHRQLQAWWAARLMAALRVTCGLHVDVDGAEALTPGPVVMLVRHASLADSLLSAWVVLGAGMWPRVVMKKELLVDPCLDIVGNRLPNCFVDRHATDSAPELAAIAAMGTDLGRHDVAVIFPEGTRVNPAKRARALEKIGGVDPERSERLSGLRHLLPPRPAGTQALLDAVPDADVVVGWHVGFEGLDTFGGIIAWLGRPVTPVRMCLRRVDRDSVPHGEGFAAWLDGTWLEVDDAVDALLGGNTDGPRRER